MLRALTLLLGLLAGAAAGQGDTLAAAREASDRLNAAAEALAEVSGSPAERIDALTETVRAYEDGLAALREGLRRATIRQQTLEARLAAEADDVARLLSVLQRMGRTPAPLLLMHPNGPVGTARGGMLVAEVTPAVQARVDELAADLAEVRDLRALQDNAAETLREGLSGAQEARAALAAAVRERTDLPRRFTEDPVQTAVLIASTETLDAFAGGLAGIIDQELGGVIPDASEVKGILPLPVDGVVLRGFGEADAAGITRPGLVIGTRARALVTTPVAATVRFQGPLLDYGTVIILEPSPGILFVLAGLAQTFGETGEVLPAGAPIGLMGGEPPAPDAILTETAQVAGTLRPETLYLEVRDGQSPVDPATWFTF